jgi:hypothetical protein
MLCHKQNHPRTTPQLTFSFIIRPVELQITLTLEKNIICVKLPSSLAFYSRKYFSFALDGFAVWMRQTFNQTACFPF